MASLDTTDEDPKTLMEMYWHRYTEGRRLFLGLHGWGGDHREFAPLAAGAPPWAAVMAVDLPGYGRSPWPAHWSVRAVGAAIGAQFAGAGGGVLIGYCSGAILALLAAQAQPEATQRLVLADPFGYVPIYFRIFTWGRLGRFFYRWAFQGATGQTVVNRALRRRQRSEADFTAAFGRVKTEVALAWLVGLTRLGRLEQFAEIRTPITLVYGERTFRAVRRSVAWMRRLWPQTRVECIPAAGHLWMARQAAALRRIVFETAAEG